MEIRFRKDVSPDIGNVIVVVVVVVVVVAAVVVLILIKPGSNIRQEGYFSYPQSNQPTVK